MTTPLDFESNAGDPELSVSPEVSDTDGLQDYQRRHQVPVSVLGHPVLSAPPPPYIGWSGNRFKSLRKPQILDHPPELGGRGALIFASFALAQELAGPDGEVIAVYLDIPRVRFLDLRSTRIYAAPIPCAFGFERIGEMTGNELHEGLMIRSSTPSQFADELHQHGFDGCCFDHGYQSVWSLTQVAGVKWGRLVTASDPNIRSLESFDPRPLTNHKNHGLP